MTNAIGDMSNFANRTAMINQTQIELLRKLSKKVPSVRNEGIQYKIFQIDILYREVIYQSLQNTLDQIAAIHGLLHLHNCASTASFSQTNSFSQTTLLESDLERLKDVEQAYRKQIISYEELIHELENAE